MSVSFLSHKRLSIYILYLFDEFNLFSVNSPLADVTGSSVVLASRITAIQSAVSHFRMLGKYFSWIRTVNKLIKFKDYERKCTVQILEKIMPFPFSQ